MGILFVSPSLTKRLKRPNEIAAYPAKLLLDGAESAQIFYDTPVMRFYIDPTAPTEQDCNPPSPNFTPHFCAALRSHPPEHYSNPHRHHPTARSLRPFILASHPPSRTALLRLPWLG